MYMVFVDNSGRKWRRRFPSGASWYVCNCFFFATAQTLVAITHTDRLQTLGLYVTDSCCGHKSPYKSIWEGRTNSTEWYLLNTGREASERSQSASRQILKTRKYVFFGIFVHLCFCQFHLGLNRHQRELLCSLLRLLWRRNAWKERIHTWQCQRTERQN